MNRKIGKNPSDNDVHLQVLDYVIAGYKLLRIMQFEEAVKSFNKAIRLKPKFANAYSGRGHALLNLGRYEESIIEYDLAIKFKPEYAGAYHSKGLALTNLGRYDEAIEAFNHVIEKDAGDVEIFIAKGSVLYALKRYEEAIIAYDKAIELEPNSSFAYQKKGKILQDLGRYDEAVAIYNQALSFANVNIYKTQSIMLSKMGIYIEQRKWDEAEAILEDQRLGEVCEEFKGTQNVLLAKCAYGKGEYARALKYCDKAIKLDNDILSTAALHIKISCLIALEKRDAIIAAENEGLQKDMNDEWILMSRAIRKIEEGDLKEADSCFRRAQRFGGIGGDKAVEVEICYFLMRAIQLKERGEYWEAIRSINDGLAHELEFQRQNLLRHKAILLNKIEYFKDALECCNEFLAKDSSNMEVLAAKAEALHGVEKYSAMHDIIGDLKSQLSEFFEGSEEEKNGQVLAFPAKQKNS